MSQQLESIYPELSPKCHSEESCSVNGTGNRFAYYILCWIILVVFIWFILYSFQPSWLMKDPPCDEGVECKKKPEIDQGKTILFAVIIALIIMVIIYFITSRM